MQSFQHIFRREGLRAQIVEGGDRACYVPSKDMIRMPDRGRFVDREAFYATLCHELIHWSGADTRLNRNLSGRFRVDSPARDSERTGDLSAFASDVLRGS